MQSKSFSTMSHLVNDVQGSCLWKIFALSSFVMLLLCSGSSEASVYHRKETDKVELFGRSPTLAFGICSYKDKYFKPGDSFRRGCDKCFCHESGFYCYTPMKPTSWPKKCHRVRTECGYRVIYEENPLVECRAYSWIG